MNKKSIAMPALAATAAAALFLAGAALTSHASAQTPAPKKAAPKAAEKNAGETFKNVTTPALKVLTVADFMGAMGVISADLGLDCADCHPGAGSDKANFVIDTPQKITARKMINMVSAINKEQLRWHPERHLLDLPPRQRKARHHHHSRQALRRAQ